MLSESDLHVVLYRSRLTGPAFARPVSPYRHFSPTRRYAITPTRKLWCHTFELCFGALTFPTKDREFNKLQIAKL
jgi:hypothetical protein